MEVDLRIEQVKFPEGSNVIASTWCCNTHTDKAASAIAGCLYIYSIGLIMA
jgi:hypothetical protein